jgi:hypothetical protein
LKIFRNVKIMKNSKLHFPRLVLIQLKSAQN